MKRDFLLSVFLPGFFTVLSGAQVDISPGVARISVIQGDVSAQRGDTGDWAAAALNQPLVGGDRISTGDRSQAELQLDHANILRLGHNAQAKIATVERTRIQVQVGQGLAYYTFFEDSEAEVEIDTPNAAVRPKSKEGVYRIEVNGFETQVVVRTGAAEISTPRGSTRVEMGQAATVRGTAADAGNVLGGAPLKDSWDSWNSDRDGLIRNAQSWNHTNRYYVGSEDLDAYGHWVKVPDHGQAWSPIVPAGWAPYRAGRWVREPYWGWTWVSYEPWGWAPYHYGRWFLYRSSWMWWPGPVDGDGNYRPEWAPAYVSFFGLGDDRGLSDGFGFGSVGWLPIGPGDHFYPWYGQHVLHFNVVKVTDTTNVTNIKRGFDGIAPLRSDSSFSNVLLAAHDVRVRNAVSMLPADHFGTGRSAPTAVSRKAFRDARMMTGNFPIVPTRETLSATDRPAGSASSMRGGQQERFYTKSQPAGAPQSLGKEAALVEEGIQGGGQVIPVREVAHLDSARPMRSVKGIERSVQPTGNAQGGHRSKSESGRSAHTPLPSRIPRSKSRSTRRMTKLAPGSRGAMARTAQTYVDSAKRQMDRGNYTAAIASYKRAWQVDGNSAAARARLERARRAMQAEREIIAARR